MKSYRYFHLDVFTDRLFSGNQLAVLVDARGLSAATMQAIATEMNFAETAFVLPPERRESDARLCIFTPGEELPMAGHPTIGATFALARAGIVSPGRDHLTLDLGVGPTPISLVWQDEDLRFAWMGQSLPTFGDHLPDPAGAAAALELPADAVAAAGLPVQAVSCGVPFLLVPIATRALVDAARLDRAAYRAFLRTATLDEMPVFLFSVEPGDDKATAYSRMFAPGMGIVEDAATGGASGPLGSYLVRHKVVTPADAGSMLSVQGVRMGRPSRIHIAVGVESGQITSVRVGGESVLAGEGILYI